MACPCPCCEEKRVQVFSEIDGYSFYECSKCKSLFLDPEYLLRIDQGDNFVTYNDEYWNFELASSWKRSYGTSLARLAEVIHYAQRDIEVFLDIASGPGFILDAVNYYIPNSADKFYAIEKYPPPRSNNMAEDAQNDGGGVH